MPIITAELAHKIVGKLGAVIDQRPGKAHALAKVWVDGRLIATFGLRRGSKKELGHDHVPNAIHTTPHDAKLLGQCPMSREQWIQKLREKGFA